MKNEQKYYRVLREARGELLADGECARLGRLFAERANGSDAADFYLCRCNISTDWIERIEQALPHIEEAISRQRRALASEGEILPIERVKRTGKDSVLYLAKHSELIPKGTSDRIRPEKIYVSRAVDNYAIYENRFLYTMLLRLKDFVDERYNVILEKEGSERLRLSFEREISIGGRNISVSLNYLEEGRGSTDVAELRRANFELYRIVMIRNTVERFLESELMQMMSSEPTVSEPLVRTNILRADPHFSECFELFCFINAYEGKGYELEETNGDSSAFDELAYNELAVLTRLSAFSASKNSLGLEKSLEEEYLRMERERAEAAEKERLRRMAEAGSLYALGEFSAEEYIELLESRLSALNEQFDAERAAREAAERESASLGRELIDTEKERARLELLCQRKDEELRAEEQKHREDMAAVIEGWKQRCEDERNELSSLHEKRIALITEEEAKKRKSLQSEHEEELRSVCDEYNSRLHAVRELGGIADAEEDFSSREGMETVMREKKAFMRFYNRHWSKAKRSIREELLWKRHKK